MRLSLNCRIMSFQNTHARMEPSGSPLVLFVVHEGCMLRKCASVCERGWSVGLFGFWGGFFLFFACKARRSVNKQTTTKRKKKKKGSMTCVCDWCGTWNSQYGISHTRARSCVAKVCPPKWRCHAEALRNLACSGDCPMTTEQTRHFGQKCRSK